MPALGPGGMPDLSKLSPGQMAQMQVRFATFRKAPPRYTADLSITSRLTADCRLLPSSLVPRPSLLCAIPISRLPPPLSLYPPSSPTHNRTCFPPVYENRWHNPARCSRFSR